MQIARLFPEAEDILRVSDHGELLLASCIAPLLHALKQQVDLKGGWTQYWHRQVSLRRGKA